MVSGLVKLSPSEDSILPLPRIIVQRTVLTIYNPNNKRKISIFPVFGHSTANFAVSLSAGFKP